VPEDRRVQSIVPDFSVRENLLLGHLSAYRGFGLGYAARDKRIAELLRLLDLPSERLLDANMLNFSGGMQQKIVIARWLLLDPRVLLLDEPTKGVDIGTRSSIYTMLQEVADRGTAVLVVSSDFEELLGLCSRIVVMSDGATIADVASAVLDEAKLTLFAAPRSSMAANARLLADLSRETGGAAFWALLDGGRLFCLNRVGGEGVADPGFVAGATPLFEETRIPAALGTTSTARSEAFVAEPDGSRRTLLAQVRSHRGHDLGWIGLTVTGTATPHAAEIVRRMQDVITRSI
jgi:ABC-type nitrate/sulfonate/bicarbonate transport system ATPase subunit